MPSRGRRNQIAHRRLYNILDGQLPEKECRKLMAGLPVHLKRILWEYMRLYKDSTNFRTKDLVTKAQQTAAYMAAAMDWREKRRKPRGYQPKLQDFVKQNRD